MFDTYEKAKEYQEKEGGIIWKHDGGFYAVTASHSEADELPEPEKWIEINQSEEEITCPECNATDEDMIKWARTLKVEIEEGK